MARLEMVQRGGDRLRVGPWRGSTTAAVLTPMPGRPSAPETIQRALSVAQARGFDVAMTSALTPSEQEPFFALGFSVREPLHLLRCDLPAAVAVPPTGHTLRVRRGWRRDYPAALRIDGLAFDPFWRFDRAGLADARAATPSSQFRVAESGGVSGPVGYAVSGRAGPLCYLQRLAVDPDAQRRGVGTALVADALRWARSHRATTVLVNTQLNNAPALELYQRLGFVREPGGLAVLHRSIDPDQECSLEPAHDREDR